MLFGKEYLYVCYETEVMDRGTSCLVFSKILYEVMGKHCVIEPVENFIFIYVKLTKKEHRNLEACLDIWRSANDMKLGVKCITD